MPNKLVFLMAWFLIVIILMSLQGSSSIGCNSHACAACRHQRRRCGEDCLLRPYFPPEQPQLFEYVHRLYGIRGIHKILDSVALHLRDDAMKSIIYESSMRFKFPVHGNLGVIWHLQNQISLVASQLDFVKSQIKEFVSPPPPATYFPGTPTTESPSSEFSNPSRNITMNYNDYVPENDYSFGERPHSGYCPVVEDETETRPLEIVENNGQECYLPNSNNLGSSPATENNDVNAFDLIAASEDYMVSIHPNNCTQLQSYDPFADLSFFQTGNKFAESPKKDDDFPFLADLPTLELICSH